MCGASLFACCRLLAMGCGCDDGCRMGGRVQAGCGGVRCGVGFGCAVRRADAGRRRGAGETEGAQAESTAKFSLIPAGVNDPGHYLAKLALREGEGLDYETQDT